MTTTGRPRPMRGTSSRGRSRPAARRALAVLLLAGLAVGCTTTDPRPTPPTTPAATDSPVRPPPSDAPPSDSSPSSASPEARATASGRPDAADFIADQVDQAQASMWVYRDFGDGANSWTQKAWMGSSTDDAPPMSEAAEGKHGTGIAASIDFDRHDWGGYLFLAGSLAAGSTDPKPDLGAHQAGWDLTGASRLTFWARGAAGGERVRFFAGGLGDNDSVATPDTMHEVSTGFVTLDRDWRSYSLDLTGPNLRSVALGFGWVTSADQNRGRTSIRFGLDEIRYEFDEPRHVPQFLTSYAPAAPGTDASIINGFAYLYDNAVAAIALVHAGRIEQARAIGDAIVYAQQHDRAFPDGRLRNAYANGMPASPPAWRGADGERFARLPGFWDLADEAWREDYYADSTATGNLAWAILALTTLHDATGEESYLASARELADLVLTLKAAGGGFLAGWEGFDDDQTRASYLSTEHNIDLVAAFRSLARAVSVTPSSGAGAGSSTAATGSGARASQPPSGPSAAAQPVGLAELYRAAADSAESFVLSMRDPATGGLWTGTTADGRTPNKDVLPLDTNTWAVLALGDALPQPERTMAFAAQRMAVGTGFDFNEDQDGIWNEGTAQAVLAFRAIGNSSAADRVMAGLQSRALPDGSIAAADRDGVTTGFMVAGTDQPWRYGNRVHLGATAWLSFAQQDVNPLAGGHGG